MNLLRNTLLVGALAGSLVTLSNAEADVIYQSIPDLTVAADSNGWCSVCSTNNTQQIGQQFTLGASALINSALFTVTSYYFWPSPVTLSIYADSGSATLGAQLFSQTYSSFASDTPTANNTDIVGVNIPSLALGAGTYDLLLTNPSHLGIPGYLIASGGTQIQVNDTIQPASVGDAYFFVYNGTYNSGLILQSTPIPEPTFIMLFSVGLLGFSAARRKKNSA
jgi:hypothetical protein